MTDYLSGKKQTWMIIGLSLAMFMQVLDSTIANVALPIIAGDLGASVSQGIWVVTSFVVANAISIPLTGFLAQRWGELRLFLASTILFIVTSIACGLSTSIGMLIIFRLCQGLVSGPMTPLVQSLLLRNTPTAKQQLAMGVFGVVIIVAPVIGPILGGYIGDNYYWGWIFFINAPIGLTALPICWLVLKDRETPRIKVPIDHIGIMLMVVGVGCFQLMLDRGRELSWFQSNEIVSLAVISAICMAYFLVWERGQTHPVIRLSLLQNRNFLVGTFVLSSSMLFYIGMVVLIPQVLETQYGYNSITAGLATAPIGIFPFLLMPIVGKMGRRVDMRILVTLAFLVFALCFFWRSRFNIHMTFWDVCLPQFVQGVAVAFYFMPLNTIIFSQIEPEYMAQATNLSNFLRTLSGGIGASVSVSLWERREIFYHSRLMEHFNTFNPNTVEWLHHANHAGMPSETSYALIDRMITQQGFIMSSNEIFYLSGIVFLFLTGLIWFSKRVI